MKVRNITGNRKSRKRLAGRAVADVSGNAADNLNALGVSRINYGASANPVDSDTVNEIRMSPVLTSADISRKETERMRRDGGKAKPSDLSTNSQRTTTWEEWYQRLWEFKLARIHKYHGSPKRNRANAARRRESQAIRPQYQ